MTVIKNQKSNTYEVRTYYKDGTRRKKAEDEKGPSKLSNVMPRNGKERLN